MILINLEQYADFDVQTHHSLWRGEAKLPLFDRNDTTTNEFIAFLKANGYIKVNTKTFIFDDYEVESKRKTHTV